jgi:hypothetical protein
MVLRRWADQPVEVVVADLGAEVPEQCAVARVHFDAQLLAARIVAFSQVHDDHAVVSGERLLVGAGQQVEGQPVVTATFKLSTQAKLAHFRDLRQLGRAITRLTAQHSCRTALQRPPHATDLSSKDTSACGTAQPPA